MAVLLVPRVTAEEPTNGNGQGADGRHRPPDFPALRTTAGWQPAQQPAI